MGYKALVFLSCGQRNEERDLAKEIAEKVEENGFACYNADTRQGFDDVMSIVDHLSKADYYLFVDFRRNTADRDDPPISIFTHQEFALARACGLTEVLAFKEEGLPAKSHGMAGYVLLHPIKFKRKELVERVTTEIKKKLESGEWRTDYSRHLIVSGLMQAPKGPHYYSDHHGDSLEDIWHVTIENRRQNLAAFNTTAILQEIKNVSTGKTETSRDTTFLKWAEQQAYQKTILPGTSARLDIFATRKDGVFLHSASDIHPRKPIIPSRGVYILTYMVYAHDFPPLRFAVQITHKGLGTVSCKRQSPIIDAIFIP